MLTLEDICEWWEHKIMNYIKKYGQINRLMLVEACNKLFSYMPEQFMEAIP
jgi:hypothetical protein